MVSWLRNRTTISVFDDPLSANQPGPISHPLPSYPQEALDRGIEGTVQLTAIVGEDGHLHSLRIQSSSNSVFESVAQDAVQRWTYRPMEINQKAVASTTTVKLRFKLTRDTR